MNFPCTEVPYLQRSKRQRAMFSFFIACCLHIHINKQRYHFANTNGSGLVTLKVHIMLKQWNCKQIIEPILFRKWPRTLLHKLLIYTYTETKYSFHMYMCMPNNQNFAANLIKVQAVVLSKYAICRPLHCKYRISCPSIFFGMYVKLTRR